MECKPKQTDQNSSPSTLPLFSIPMDSPERSGMLTPPIYATVSVPFRWEEQPGKPRFSTATAASPNLELPPRLLLIEKVARSECCSSFRMMGSSLRHDEKSCLFGSWRRRGLNLRGNKEEERARFRRNGRFSRLMSTHIRPRFWESVCEGLKHAVPSWRSKRVKREA